MAESGKARRITAKNQTLKFEDLLSKHPPGDVHAITNLGVTRSPSSLPILIKPRLKLHCPDSFCNGIRFFDAYQTRRVTLTEKWSRVFLHYSCSNCRSRSKVFAIMARWNEAADEGEAVKLGEWPPFGPQVGMGIISILGKNKDLFLMGRRAEMQGLGIGALAYYRRVVESQKDSMVDEIIRVWRRTNSPEAQIEKLKSAKGEKQFKKAVELVSDAIPQALLINGYNPFALLEQAITKGEDVQTDNEALQLATAIRIILTELAERLVRVLEDQTNLDTAVNYILSHE